MPHYIAKPTHKSLKYYIFSTVVMAPITDKMYRKDMIAWLKSNPGYEVFLDPRPANEVYPDMFGDLTSTWAQKELALTYWNGDFWYVTEEDGYFV